jgi:DNA-binding CsgD family transcriptional regulator
MRHGFIEISAAGVYREIANALGISRSTASKHVENILKKMKVPTGRRR